MKQLSEHILAVARDHDLNVTNLQLQKTLYFMIREYVKENPDYKNDRYILTLYDKKFEAWPYGPVIPEIYYSYKFYAGMPIQDSGNYHLDYRIFDELICLILKKNIFDLVKITHRQPLWKNNKEDILNRNGKFVYELGDIYDDPET